MDVKFESWWDTIGIQMLRNTVSQIVIHLWYPKLHLLSHISESIQQMGSSDTFTSDISEQLHIAIVKEAYRSSNKVNYIRRMLNHDNRCAGLDYME